MFRIQSPLFACFLTPLLFGQSEIGGANLNGTIVDPSGAAVVGARITATNANTGLARVTETNESGLFNFVRLPVGTYGLLVEKQGFKPTRRAGLVLSVGAVATLSIPLEIGATQEAITVTAEVPLVEATRW